MGRVSDNVKPKSVVRELYERAMTFGEYIQHYGLKRSEGVLLRYLSDVYRGLQQNVPDELGTHAIDDLVAWLGALVRQVDSSLIDEWERLVNPVDGAAIAQPVRPDREVTVVDDTRAFRVMVRNQVFDWVQRLASRKGYDVLVAASSETGRFESGADIADTMADYWDEFDEIGLGPGARSGDRFSYDASSHRVRQIIHDPDDTNEWAIEADVDVDESITQGRAVLRLVDIGRRTDS